MEYTGLFEPGKSYSRWASGVITTKQTNDTTRIRIDKENLKQFFPKNEWRDYNRRNQQL